MMPETPMYKDTDPQPRQYDVGLTRQVFAMQPIPISTGMQKTAYKPLGLRVLASNPGHHTGPFGRINDVHKNPQLGSVIS